MSVNREPSTQSIAFSSKQCLLEGVTAATAGVAVVVVGHEDTSAADRALTSQTGDLSALVDLVVLQNGKLHLLVNVLVLLGGLVLLLLVLLLQYF